MSGSTVSDTALCACGHDYDDHKRPMDRACKRCACTRFRTVAKRLPRGFRRGHSDALACTHRDVSCCEACAAKHPEIVDVYGEHFWVPDPCERLELKESIAHHERERREYRADASGGYDDEPHFDGGRRSDADGGL